MMSIVGKPSPRGSFSSPQLGPLLPFVAQPRRLEGGGQWPVVLEVVVG